MKNIFSGFPNGKVRQVPIPITFFTDLLPRVDDLAELKLVLFAFYHLQYLEGTFRYFRREDFLEKSSIFQELGEAKEDTEKKLDEALKKSVQRGTLLEATLELNEKNVSLYFLNTARGRAAVEAIKRGEWRATGQMNEPIELVAEPPNIFQLYEEHIGPITPLIAESLMDAEKLYPAEWIEEAIRKAVERNARNWRYVTAILKKWKEEGKLERKDRQDTEEDLQRYKEWEDPHRTR